MRFTHLPNEGNSFSYKICFFLSLFLFLPSLSKAAIFLDTWNTDAGMPVYFVHVPNQMLDIQLVWDAGSARDGKQWGLGYITNQMITDHPQQWDTNQFAIELDTIGAILSHSVSRDIATVGIRTLIDPYALEKSLVILKAILKPPSFSAQDIEKQKRLTLRAIDMAADNPKIKGIDALYQLLYDSYPYGHNVLGFSKTIHKISTHSVEKFYHTYYVLENAKLILVGDISKEEAKKIAFKIEHFMPRGYKPKPVVMPPVDLLQTKNASMIKKVFFPSQESYVYRGGLFASNNFDDYWPLLVGNNILGEAPLLSRLALAIRVNKGYAYFTGSFIQFMPMVQSLILTIYSRSNVSLESLKISQDILRDFIEKGPTDLEVIEAKKRIINQFVLSFDNSDAILAQVLQIVSYNFPKDYFQIFNQKVAEVTPNKIQQAFRKNIHLNQFKTVIVSAS